MLQMLSEIVIFVNKTDLVMVQRITKVMQHYHLSATQFASEIGIQRSALSHIMSGRNKPSLDFMLKLKSRFNDINSDWLLFGTGKMLNKTQPTDALLSQDGEMNFPESAPDFNEELSVVKSEEPAVYGKKRYPEEKSIEKKSPKPVDKGDFEIEKIIILYKNGRFKSYKPT